MCLIAFAIGASPRWPLVIASNRDEFLERPTLPLARWHTDLGHEIISGRDMRAGGTWLGVTPGGRVAFLTNVREASPQPAPFSRGQLVMRWLDAGNDVASFAEALEKDNGAYGGFNLVVGDMQRNNWAWMSNKSSAFSSGWHIQSLQPGIYGLSNAALDTPWLKTTELKRVLTNALAETHDAPDLNALQKPLWNALANRIRAPIEKLPATGAPLAIEEALSSAFVDFPEHQYGTRCSTLLLATRTEDVGETTQSLQIQVEERTHFQPRIDELVTPSTSVMESFVLNID